MITEETLRKIAPSAPKSVYAFVPYLNVWMEKFHITTYNRITTFLAQLAHESGSFRYVRELASGKAYEGRADLGNIYPGDGIFFKGRGLIQITGRSNYRACSLALFGDLRLLKNPELLESPQYAVASACWFWSMKGLNEIADQPGNAVFVRKEKKYTKIEWITLKINGGQNGLSDRKQFYEIAKKINYEL